MTAGSGIMHQEMPQGDPQGRMHGFQLWANLPASLKMTAPRYQDIAAADIPEVVDDDGTRVRVIVGDFWGKQGPVEGVAADPQYIDVSVPPGKRKRLKVDTTRHAFAYVFAGSGSFRDASDPRGVLTEATDGSDSVHREEAGNRSLVLFDNGDEVVVQAQTKASAFCWSPANHSKSPSRGRTHRDEHAGRTAAGHERPARRHLHQVHV
jgi:redox-sensitive bicupin YhaK (pirin superfamily)